MKCETCGATVTTPVEGINVISSRDYLWHAVCADVIWINGKAVVDFPSNGKLIPDTILER